MSIRVSIVTPSFNQAAYLEQTIRSVLSQGYPNLEYIIIDGGSNDGSVEIIQKYARYLAYWESTPDNGQAEAINKGFNRATGDIVAWLNSDDCYMPGAVIAAVEALKNHPDWGMVYGDVLAIDGENKMINVMRYQDWGLDDLMRFNIIGQPAVFMRKTVLDQAGLLDTHFHYLLDHQMWLRMNEIAPMGYRQQIWAAGRFHAEAKNLAQAAAFGQEAYALVDWMQSQPKLAERFNKQRRKIISGAHWINARYLSEGGKPAEALKAFSLSFFRDPACLIRDWQRFFFTILQLFDTDKAQSIYQWLRSRRQPQSLDVPQWQSMPIPGESSTKLVQ